jgi:hypothetical protein
VAGDFSFQANPRMHLRFARQFRYLRPASLLGFLLGLLLTGCRPEEQIRTYEVASLDAVYEQNHVDVEEAPGPDRMLGAMLPFGDNVWYFKLTGASDRVAKLREPMIAFLKTVDFPANDAASPRWILPSGWTQTGRTETRYATLSIPQPGQALELSVSSLPKPPGGSRAFERPNLNRWRGQMGRPSLTARRAAKVIETIDLPAGRATFVDITGESKGSSGMPPGVPPRSKSRPPAPPRGDLSFDLPPGWRQVEAGGPRLATFVIEANGQAAEVAISDLGGGGELLENVNRWRDQVGLTAPLAETDLGKTVESVIVEGQTCPLATMIGPEIAGEPALAILAAIIPRGESKRFVKLIGHAELAQRERANFRAFVESLKSGQAAPENRNGQ